MYKQQKPLTITSGLIALFVTVLVLLVASYANAEDTDTEPVVPLPLRGEVDTAREARQAVQATENTDIRARNEALAEERKAEMEQRRQELSSQMTKRKEAMEVKRAEFAEKLADRKIDLAEKRALLASSTALRRAALADTAQDRVRNIADRLTGVLDNAIQKLSQFSVRLRDRAEQLEDRKVDTAEVIFLLDEVDRLIATAKSSIDDIDTNIEFTVTSDQPREDWQDAKAQFQESQSILREAHQFLREAVEVLKQAVREAELERGVSPAVAQDKENNDSEEEPVE